MLQILQWLLNYKYCVKSESESVSCTLCLTLCDPMDWRLLCPWNSPVKNIGVGGHLLFQGISLTQGLNPGLLHCRQILYHLSHPRSPNRVFKVCYLVIPKYLPDIFISVPSRLIITWCHVTLHALHLCLVVSPLPASSSAQILPLKGSFSFVRDSLSL